MAPTSGCSKAPSLLKSQAIDQPLQDLARQVLWLALAGNGQEQFD
jgi:hypothetical protein